MNTNDQEGPGDILTARDQLVEAISNQIELHGYYLSTMDPSPHQALVDVRWAAQLAGRRLGQPLRTYASTDGKPCPGKITLIIAPLETRSREDDDFCDRPPNAIGEMLDRNVAVLVGSRPA
jgi:hypothetical protein